MESIIKNIGRNIRKCRMELGLTQSDLAARMGYSVKAISKWECGNGAPPTEVLPVLAKNLHISIDSLLSESGQKEQFFLGIDGGGTKTAFALADNTGNIIQKLQLGPSNPFDVGLEATKNVLKMGIHQICLNLSPNQIFLFAGIAGAVSGTHHKALEEFLQEFRFAGARLGSDNENIIAAGLGERDGITMILGTGVCSYVVQNGSYHRISGWGYLFDEGGSGYNIARDAFSQYFANCDGSGLPTSLTAGIEERSGCDPATLMNKLYEGGKKVIASYADIVFKEAEKGDAVSCSILRRNAAEVARIIRAARAHFPQDNSVVPVILAGGLTEQPLLLSYLREALGDMTGIELKILSVSPVEGALQKAKHIWQETI